MSGNLFDSFHDPALAGPLADSLNHIDLKRPLRLMHVCGTHEHAIARAGLRAFLPEGLRLVAGPGCPVCVCPARDIDTAVEAAVRDGVIVTTFGDMFRVPSSRTSMEEMKAAGSDIRIVYSPMDAIGIARENPDREVIFMAVGFETTAAPIAASLASGPPANFSIIPSIRLIPPALEFLLERGGKSIDGFLLPGHVSAIIGRQGYHFLETGYDIPGAIAGFEPVDILRAVLALVRQANAEGTKRVENLYRRVVGENGNGRAKDLLARVFREGDSDWRGIGTIPASGLLLRDEYTRFDAARKLGLENGETAMDLAPGCICHKVILGDSEPEECRLFGKECTPRRPHGPCMVSSEGTCRARFLYRPPG